jgi:NFU1 iron-sulfur cluster scaffold homolog, mitochondrial
MFIQTEETPNPNALKFLPNQDISPDSQVHFSNRDECRGKSLLAFKLFDTEDVKAVFLGSDFITITKSAETDWSILKPKILMTIMDHLVSGLPVLDSALNHDISINTEGLSDIEKQIVEIIETRVRPSVAIDGGDIVYKGFKDGIVYLELRGSCSGCPSSTITLKNGIESMLKHFVPEVESVEAVEEEV